MRKWLLFCVMFALLSIFLLDYAILDRDQFILYYAQHLRGNLFTGFLTVGGFLLSLKTFILIKLKENVYDHEEYVKLYEEQKKLDNTLKLYAPLQKLSDFLFWSVFSSMIAAIAQLTFGLFGWYIFALLSLFLAIFSVLTLMASLFLIKASLEDYFKFIDQVQG